MRDLTIFLPKVESKPFGTLTLGKRHIYETIIIQTSAGRYHFSKSKLTLTLPTGQSFDEADYKTILEVENNVVKVNMAPLQINATWGPPVRTESAGDNQTLYYSNGGEVTFVDEKAVSIGLKGIKIR
ncbi:MAG: hypothetical protein K0R57_1579 [Paenibacillaceae bacterium]|nr:hypothetical protein [Paenibacillaceae bacterium]